MAVLRRWALLLLSVVLLSAVALVGLHQTREAQARGEAVIGEERLSLQRTMTALNDAYIAFVSATATENLVARTWSLEQGDPADRESLRAMFDAGLAAEQLGTMIVDSERRVLSSFTAPGVALPDVDDPRYDPLFAALQVGVPGVSDVLDVGTGTGMAVGVKLSQGGRQAVALVHYPVGDHTLASQFARRLDAGRGATGYVVDRGGVVLSSSRAGVTGSRLPDEAVLAALATGTRGLVAVGEGDRTVVTYERSSLTGFRTLTVQPESVFYASVREGVHAAGLTVLLLLVLAAAGLAVLNERRQRLLRRLASEALVDPLTRLGNRARFTEHLTQSLRDVPADAEVALLFCDLDRFKQVNDTLGHEAGDELLRQVADRLRHCAREDAVLARLGGDEFTLVLPAVTTPEAACAVAERVVEALQRPFLLAGTSVEIGASIGVARGGRGADLESLLRDADLAMYRSKDQGRGRYELFDLDMRPTAPPAAPSRLSVGGR